MSRLIGLICSYLLQLAITFGGMWSCRPFSAGMVFCLLHGQGRSCPGTINLLNRRGKKTWKHARWPAGLSMLRDERSCPGR
jgi:hypothetical protein